MCMPHCRSLPRIDKTGAKTGEKAGEKTAAKKEPEDYQLSRAVDLLRGIALYKTLNKGK